MHQAARNSDHIGLYWEEARDRLQAANIPYTVETTRPPGRDPGSAGALRVIQERWVAGRLIVVVAGQCSRPVEAGRQG